MSLTDYVDRATSDIDTDRYLSPREKLSTTEFNQIDK